MNISFGNTFHLYCDNYNLVKSQNKVLDLAHSEGAAIERVYPKYNSDGNCGLIRTPIDGRNVRHKDVITVRNNEKLDDEIRSYCIQQGFDFVEIKEDN